MRRSDDDNYIDKSVDYDVTTKRYSQAAIEEEQPDLQALAHFEPLLLRSRYSARSLQRARLAQGGTEFHHSDPLHNSLSQPCAEFRFLRRQL